MSGCMEDQVADFYPAGTECGGSFAVAYNSRPYGLCKKSGCGYRQKGSSVYRCRSHHRGSYPQSDPRAYRRSILGKQTWYAVPLATAVGVPMYADIFGTIPVAESLLAKGQDLERFLSFMMAVTTLSFHQW